MGESWVMDTQSLLHIIFLTSWEPVIISNEKVKKQKPSAVKKIYLQTNHNKPKSKLISR